MKKLAFVFLLVLFSMPVVAQSSKFQGSVKDISTELASINQEIADAYQVEQNETQPISNVQVKHSDRESIQINIPVAAYQDASATLQHQVSVKNKSSAHNVSKKQAEDIYEMIINKMRALKKKYENNPYIRVSGFDINVAIVPSVTISIEFKK